MNDIDIGQQNLRIQKAVAFVAVLLFAVKLIAWTLTHSVAIYTDMMESIVNILAAFIGLYSLHFSAQPRDEKHPYGHGKIEFISAALEGIFICAAGFLIIAKIISSYKNGHVIEHLDLGIGLIVLTAIVNYAMGVFCILKGKKSKSLALIASGKHLQTDTWSTLGVIAGLVIVKLTNYIWLDNAIAAILACFIIHTGVKIIRASFAGIVDEADPELIEEVVAHINANRRPNWIDLHKLRIIKYGRILHFDAHMTVPGHLTVHEAHEELDILEKIMQEKYGSNVEMFIHLDPSDENIDYSDHLITNWTVGKVLGNKKHFKDMK